MKGFVIWQVIFLLIHEIHGASDWWRTMSLYQIYPRSFKDSDGDGTGDLKGIESKLQHLVDSKFNAFWLSPIYASPMKDFGYDISNFREIDPIFGTMEDFENLIEKAHDLSLKVIMDLVPNHSSDEHEWFQKSVKKIEPYTDYYVWNEGKVENGNRYPPNNWLSVFYGSGWTWNEERQAFYFHQFLPEQPDLNYRNPLVVEEMKNVMRFWLDKGVDGFRIDAVPHLFEDNELDDEPLSGRTNDSNSFLFTDHVYTTNQLETYQMIRQWRNVVDEYESENDSRIIILEVYADIKHTMDYYCYGAHFPFNFDMMLPNSNISAKGLKSIVDDWMSNMPIGSTANWVAGNHDNSRLATRFGTDYALIITSILQLLPGVAVTYYGDEIGMEDTWISWEETQDLSACKVGKDKYEKASRDPERSPFQWDASTSAGFSDNPKPWLRVNDNYKEVNLDAQKEAGKSFYKDFLKITDLRQWPAVKEGSLQTKLLNDNVFAFSRELKGEESVYLVVNTNDEAEVVSLEAFENIPKRFELYLALSGTQNIEDGEIVNSNSITIDARSGLIFVTG